MTLEEAIYGLLAADAGVSGVLGARIYPDQAPQGATMPYCVYSEADRASTMTMDGPVSLDAWTMTLEVEADSKASVRRAAQAIRNKMLGFRGVVSGLTIRGIFDQSETGSLEIPNIADERGVFAVAQDFTIWYRQL